MKKQMPFRPGLCIFIVTDSSKSAWASLSLTLSKCELDRNLRYFHQLVPWMGSRLPCLIAYLVLQGLYHSIDCIIDDIWWSQRCIFVLLNLSVAFNIGNNGIVLDWQQVEIWYEFDLWIEVVFLWCYSSFLVASSSCGWYSFMNCTGCQYASGYDLKCWLSPVKTFMALDQVIWGIFHGFCLANMNWQLEHSGSFD